MTLQELRDIALHAAKGTAPANFTVDNVNEAFVDGLKEFAGSYNQFMKNRYDLYDIIIESIDQILPKNVEDAFGAFAEVKRVAQGEKAMFKRKLGRQRAKKFLTQVGLSGVYETFRLDSDTFEVGAHAVGGGATSFGAYTEARAENSVAWGLESKVSGGRITINGWLKGKTTVTVTDTKVQRSVDIAVKVISSNFYMMSMAQSRHPSLKPDLVSCFIPSDKEQRDVLFFVQRGGGLLFFTRGTYSTTTEDDADYLVLRYPSSSKDNTISDAEGAVMMEHKFLLRGSSSDALDILQARGPLTGRFTDPGQLIHVHLAEVGLPYEMEANIKFGPFYTLPIPFGYLE